jgi:hypothetical protein
MVDYYQDSIVTVAIRQMRDKIHRNVLPGSLGNRKKSQNSLTGFFKAMVLLQVWQLRTHRLT